jgi:hypothetical protein
MAESRVNVKPALAPWAFAVLCAYAISLGLAAAGSSVRYSASGVPYWSLQDPGMSVAVATFVSIVLLAPLTLLTCIVTLCVLVVHGETLSRIRPAQGSCSVTCAAFVPDLLWCHLLLHA